MTVHVQTTKEAQLAMALGYESKDLVLDCPLYLPTTVKFALEHGITATI